jgi:hypothetical protein
VAPGMRQYMAVIYSYAQRTHDKHLLITLCLSSSGRSRHTAAAVKYMFGHSRDASL